MSKKSWKDHFLSSGVPLEYSIVRIFEGLGFSDPDEFRYERKTANGLSRIFSVDVHSSSYDTAREVWIDSLVECKYRHDGTNWLFTPKEYGERFGPNFADFFVILDQCCFDRQVDRGFLDRFQDRYSLCAKGIELLPDDANPKTIEQAVYQLRYAVIAKAVAGLRHQTDWPRELTMPIRVIVPIIVTTADLWRLKMGMTVEDVRRAEDMTSIADPHDFLVLLERPDDLQVKDTRAAIAEHFSADDMKALDTLMINSSGSGLSLFVHNLAEYTPSMFLIVSYKRAKAAIENLNSFFKSDGLVKKRELKG
jgi:hypothetical protein